MIPFDYITEWRAEAPWIDDAQVEQNLALTMRDGAFLADLSPLLATGEAWDPIAAEALISQRLVTLLPGDAWKGEEYEDQQGEPNGEPTALRVISPKCQAMSTPPRRRCRRANGWTAAGPHRRKGRRRGAGA